MGEFFSLIGTFKIAEEKKDEFNELVVKLLDKCGIRKINEITLGDKAVSVISQLQPDSDGIIHFDYSIFEKKKRNVSTYNMNTCELRIDDCGYDYFGIAMMLLMTMQESYSVTQCYLFQDGEIVGVNRKALILENILGIKLRFPYRAEPWKIYMFSKENSNVKTLTVSDILNSVPDDFEPMKYRQIVDIVRCEKNLKQDADFEHMDYSRARILEYSHLEREGYLYNTYIKLLNREDLEGYIKNLITSSLPERKKMAEDDTEFGVLAELSLYNTPMTLVRILACAKGDSFWDLWNKLSSTDIYLDYYEADIEADKLYPRPVFCFYEAIVKENEDELYGLWDDRELFLSDKMQETIVTWKKVYDAIPIPENFDMEKELLSILTDIESDWNMEYIEEKLLKDMLENKEDDNYQKGLLLLRKKVDNYLEYFPELTRRQAMQWIIGQYRNEFDEIELEILMRVLTNSKTRKEILGF